MKLRMRGNSIRLRLSQDEVAQLNKIGQVEETVEFGLAAPALSYRLETTVDSNVIKAAFRENCLSVLLPEKDAEHWVNSQQVGIESIQPLGDNRSLRILVEKDFACLATRPQEDDTDAFPNPMARAS